MTQPTLLAVVHGLRCDTQSCRSPGLDLHEGQQRAAAGDQVDLDAIRPNVATHDAITSRFEVPGRLLLALTTE